MVPMLSETLTAALDLVALVCTLMGAMLCVAAAIGLLRFPDILSRQHAATKPQVLGVLLVLLAVAISQRSIATFTMVSLVAVFQLLTAPVSSQMMSRAAVRTSQVELGRVDADPINPAHPPTPKRRRERSEKGDDPADKTPKRARTKDDRADGKTGENPEAR